MKKIYVLLVIALFMNFGIQMPSDAGIIAKQKAKIEQKRNYKSTLRDIKNVILTQDKLANKYDYDGLYKLYSDNFVNSDGFNKEVYFKLIKETWEVYPDISYTTEIKNIEFNDNYATVFVKEVAVAAPKEEIGGYSTVGELHSVSKCVYHLERYGNNWLISSEKIIEETSTLKYGEARYVDFELDTPKQIGSDKYYTVKLKVDLPKDTVAVASISNEKIIYPQTKSEDAFRRLTGDNLERVFKSNSDNINEYAVASVGLTHTENYDEEHVKVYMSGLGFIMTRINVIPENKYIKSEAKNEQSK
ncbi:hypothetical protein J6P92_00950 [bacterium]|nr:hypothetical protein [bacterium]